MNECQEVVKSPRQHADHFFYCWLSFYFCGVLCGLLAARAACSGLASQLAVFCNHLCPDGRPPLFPMLWSSLLLLVLTVLFSQLPGAGFWLSCLVGTKAFCTAYVFGIFYLLRENAGFLTAAFFLALHAALFLPAFFFLGCHCHGLRLAGRGRYWFRYRILPVIGSFAYLFVVVWLESLLMARF